MFFHGLHRVAELRERATSTDDVTDVELWLPSETPTGSHIIMGFKDRTDISLDVVQTRPNPVIQYSRPRTDLAEVLQSLPVGSLVSSSLAVPATGQPYIRLTRIADQTTTLRSDPVSGLFETGADQAKSVSTKTQSVDAKLLHVWESSGRKYEFRADGAYLVHDSQSYALDAAGQELNWGGLIFHRLSGDPGYVAGHWVSSTQTEDVLLRPDGTYVWHTVGELIDALGEWSTKSGRIDSAELRASVSTSGADIHFDAVFGGTSSGTYALSNGDKTLTVDFGGFTVVYTRA